ncbi:MAG: hypothetical protein ABI275_05490 [Terrimesophilobacter sp.]
MRKKLLAAGSALLLVAGLISLGAASASAAGNGHGADAHSGGASSASNNGDAEHLKVNICHATNSDTNPYTYINVSVNSIQYEGHLAHHTSPNKTWKTNTTFNGVLHLAGSPKADLIDGMDNVVVTKTLCDGTGTTAAPPRTHPTARPSSTNPTCLPGQKAASYVYSAAGNSGTITVVNPDPKKYTNTLCETLYVAAASWSYTGASQWPQNLDQWNALAGIKTVGAYKFAATVTCGQGGIYSSWGSAMPQPKGQLTGARIGYAEHFLHQDVAPHSPNTWVVNDPGCFTAPPAHPVDVCSNVGGVQTEVPADLVQVGSACLTFNPPTLAVVTPVVTSSNITCKTAGSFTLGEADGIAEAIVWKVDGEPATAGRHVVEKADTVTVTAVPSDTHGFDFGIDNPSTWTLSFTAPENCGDLTTLALPGDEGLAATGADSNAVNFWLLFAGALLMLGGGVVIAEKKFRFTK